MEALIKNNVFGAIKLLNLCEGSPPKYFFSVSTDKAANPVNVMGASKSLMEKLILSKIIILEYQQLDLRMLLFLMEVYWTALFTG